MNVLLMTNCMVQPDDIDAAGTDVVTFFAKAWAALGHNVVLVHNESKFPKILYVLPQFVYAWLKKKQNISIPSLSSRKVLEREDSGVKIIRLPIGKMIPHGKFSESKYNKQAQKIKNFLEKNKFIPDVITGHWMEPQLKLINMLGKHYNAKTGFVIHGELPKVLNAEYIEYIKDLNCFFTRSESVRKKLLEDANFGYLNADKTAVCCSGVPDKFIESAEPRTDWQRDGVFRVIYVGRLIRYKRIDATLKALAAAFPDGGYTFDIVGDGTEKETLISLAKSLGISENVIFHGRVSREKVIGMMRKADCFVMASENEVFGLVYLESMACGCITVASRDGGVDGIITHGENGFLCRQGNDKELTALLCEIKALSKERACDIRQAAFTTVEDYSDTKVADRYLADIVSRER